ncbi:unnamed protein product [Schistocephalus solidus]|uniref:Reverse transcriptase domain-containing protein n=1 Tax=Schistocephalus solidus TaxID=70667 RepID=A0A183TIE4_SCHSO|nr:unnamed protein product [Schistocephalus solidus]
MRRCWQWRNQVPYHRSIVGGREHKKRFYGLPKVYKEGTPLRPIVSLKGTQTYGLIFLTADLDTTVSYSTQCFEKLKELSLLPSDVMVAFDVTCLFTSIPRDLAVETIELLLRDKYEETQNPLGHAQILQLLKFCLKTYIKFDGTIYEQVKGPSMVAQLHTHVATLNLPHVRTIGYLVLTNSGCPNWPIIFKADSHTWDVTLAALDVASSDCQLLLTSSPLVL